MQIRTLTEIRREPIEVELYEVFPEGWRRSREFSLYKSQPRPCHALFFVCTDIEVTFFPADSAIVTAKKGDVVWIPAGCCYEVRLTGTPTMDINTYTVNFTMLDADRTPISISDRITVLTCRRDHAFAPHLRNLSDSTHRMENPLHHDRPNLFKIKGEFYLLLDLIADTMEQRDELYYPIRKGVDLLCMEWNKNERIETYAAACGISETYFYRCFQKWSGSSPVAYRNMIRLSYAENLLRCTNMQIREIAEMVGFDDAFYFCRLFSARFGRSPRRYREEFRAIAPESELPNKSNTQDDPSAV